MPSIIFWGVLAAIMVAAYGLTMKRATKGMRYVYYSWPIGLAFALWGFAIGLAIDTVIYYFFYATGIGNSLGIAGFA